MKFQSKKKVSPANLASGNANQYATPDITEFGMLHFLSAF
jgi:hypothetical protein